MQLQIENLHCYSAVLAELESFALAAEMGGFAAGKNQSADTTDFAAAAILGGIDGEEEEEQSGGLDAAVAGRCNLNSVDQ